MITEEKKLKGTVSQEQSLKGSMRDIPSIDKTLTKEGYAADSKTVGDALQGKAPTIHQHKKEDITNFPTSLPASDVYNWAKQPQKPSYTASEVGARPSTWMPTASDVGAHPNTWLPTPEQIGALPISGGTMRGSVDFTSNSIENLGALNRIGIRKLDWRDPPEAINIPTPQRFTALVSVSFNGGGYALYQVTSNSGRYIDNVTKLNGNVDHVSFTINTDYILTITSDQNWSHGFVIWSY